MEEKDYQPCTFERESPETISLGLQYRKKELPVAVAVAGDPLAASGGAAVQKVRHLAYSAALAPAAQIPSLGDAAQ